MAGSGLVRMPVKTHLLQGTGGVAQIATESRRALTTLSALTVEEFTNPPAADDDAIKASFVTAVAARSFTGAALDGVIGAAILTPPRVLVVTTAGPDASFPGPFNVVVIGRDVFGNRLTESFAITAGSNPGAVAGIKAFARVTEIQVPASPDALGSIKVGTLTLMGLGLPLKYRAGLQAVVREVAVAAVVTTGTFSTPAANPPNGAYDPASAPDGVKDYALYYEYVVR